jgi:hypothetical protein
MSFDMCDLRSVGPFGLEEFLIALLSDADIQPVDRVAIEIGNIVILVVGNNGAERDLVFSVIKKERIA